MDNIRKPILKTQVNDQVFFFFFLRPPPPLKQPWRERTRPSFGRNSIQTPCSPPPSPTGTAAAPATNTPTQIHKPSTKPVDLYTTTSTSTTIQATILSPHEFVVEHRPLNKAVDNVYIENDIVVIALDKDENGVFHHYYARIRKLVDKENVSIWWCQLSEDRLTTDIDSGCM